MKPNQCVLAFAMFVATLIAVPGFALCSANHRHARLAHRHHNR